LQPVTRCPAACSDLLAACHGVPAEIRDFLLPFQEKAVQLACRHLNKRNGVLVGDVVGLGKTRVASAIARVMADDQMLETLILCPKNLTRMWQDYARKFGLRAPHVMSQSVAQRDLADLPRYRLVIIDESHNFRNREGKIYKAIHEYLSRNDCKVILLSATPYNKTYLDLGAQLRLFLNEQQDIGIRPEAMLREVGESNFALKNPNTPVSSLGAFEKSIYPDDWRDIMRLFLVRRTRSFIIRNYAETDERNGLSYLTLPNGERMYFPVRTPVSVKFRSDPDDPADACARLFRDEVVQIIDHLNLPRYGRSLYKKDVLPPDLMPAEKQILDDLSRAGKRMKGFCRTNLFKRLESSANAFLLPPGETRRLQEGREKPLLLPLPARSLLRGLRQDRGQAGNHRLRPSRRYPLPQWRPVPAPRHRGTQRGRRAILEALSENQGAGPRLRGSLHPLLPLFLVAQRHARR
jgi:hypothetical protein